MWKNRTTYIGLILLSVILLYFTAKPVFLLWLAGLFLLAMALLFCLYRDTGKIRISMEVQHGSQEGKNMSLCFRLEHTGRLTATGSVLVELQIRNIMFHTIEKKRFLIPLENGKTVYELDWPVTRCGEIRFHCERIQIRDVLRLFSLNIRPFAEVSTVCYPVRMEVQAEISGADYGISREEGATLNRKGNDPSEMFDIREYVPGDDIRSIHWKLSSKTEELILRQASEPSHYDVAILPDFGRNQWGAALRDAEGCGAIALATALAEQLVEQGYAFCMILPTDGGLQVREIRSERQFQQVLAAWMGFRIQGNAGNGLQFFRMQHLEEQFTRLVVLSAGKYEQDLKGMEDRIGITILNVMEGLEETHREESGNCVIAEFPAGQAEGNTYRVIC